MFNRYDSIKVSVRSYQDGFTSCITSHHSITEKAFAINTKLSGTFAEKSPNDRVTSRPPGYTRGLPTTISLVKQHSGGDLGTLILFKPTIAIAINRDRASKKLTAVKSAGSVFDTQGGGVTGERPKYFDNFSPEGGCSKGLDAIRLFSKLCRSNEYELYSLNANK